MKREKVVTAEYDALPFVPNPVLFERDLYRTVGTVINVVYYVGTVSHVSWLLGTGEYQLPGGLGRTWIQCTRGGRACTYVVPTTSRGYIFQNSVAQGLPRGLWAGVRICGRCRVFESKSFHCFYCSKYSCLGTSIIVTPFG